MSALAKWFKGQGREVFGYDKTSTAMTRQLEKMGIPVHYQDAIEQIPSTVIASKNKTLVVYTPAIPSDHKEFSHLSDKGFIVKKRSQVLGEITSGVFTVAVAGTHGKTTTSTMIAHLLRFADKNITAFLGGISTNYETNYIEGNLTDASAICVVEADEYDRSFLRLHPDYAIVTAMDADHLDIYGAKESLQKSFMEFLQLVPVGGTILTNIELRVKEGLRYGIEKGDA